MPRDARQYQGSDRSLRERARRVQQHCDHDATDEHARSPLGGDRGWEDTIAVSAEQLEIDPE